MEEEEGKPAKTAMEEVGDEPAVIVMGANSTDAKEEVTGGDGDDSLPDYVCCVVTEGIWTYFAAALLIIVLFAIATLKYCKKYLAKPR